MEVWWVMVTPVHGDHYSVELAESGHSASLVRMSDSERRGSAVPWEFKNAGRGADLPGMGFFDGLDGDEERPGWQVGPRRRWSPPPTGRLSHFAYTDPEDYDVPRGERSDEDEEADEESVDRGPEFHPMPDEKPDPRAQWDGIRGCWTVYDPTAGEWEAITPPVGEDDGEDDSAGEVTPRVAPAD